VSRKLIAALLLVLPVAAQPRRVLYVTHSAGFRHDSIQVSIPVMRALSSRLEVIPTQDLSLISAENLRSYDAVFFFTSGELALAGGQKTALLEFVRRGGGFGGVHSATDTLYTWPEYGQLIGGYFDGHPWAQEVGIDIEDPNHPAAEHLFPSFRIVDEIYQFREFRRDGVRVLMSLDPTSVDLKAPGVHPDTQDFPLAWVKTFGEGRVFYSALGHFDDTWRDPRFQRMLEGALLWLTRQTEGAAEARKAAAPAIAAVVNAATGEPRDVVAPGSLISIYGSDLSSGGTRAVPYATRGLGTAVRANGVLLPLLYVSPGQINAMIPQREFPETVRLEVSVPGATPVVREVRVVRAVPGVFAAVPGPDAITVWATGLGALPVSLWARLGGVAAPVLFAGASAEFPGLVQVNVGIPAGTQRSTHSLELGLDGAAPFFSGRVDLPGPN
jgi:type 1 glutamine amidotransferase